MSAECEWIISSSKRLTNLYRLSLGDDITEASERPVDKEYRCSRVSPLRAMRGYICFGTISMGYAYTTKACFGSKHNSSHLPDLVVIEYFGYDCPIRQLTPSTAPGPDSADHWSRLGMSFPKYAVIQRAWTCAIVTVETERYAPAKAILRARNRAGEDGTVLAYGRGQ